MRLENLKKMRIDKGLTRAELAKVLGVTTDAVARWEQGANAASKENMAKLRRVFLRESYEKIE